MKIIAIWCNGAQTAALMFDTDSAAEDCYRAIVAKDRGEDDFEIEVADHYGTRCMVNRDNVDAIVMQDLAEAHKGQAEAQLVASRAQAALHRRASQDPALRVLAPGGMPALPFKAS